MFNIGRYFPPTLLPCFRLRTGFQSNLAIRKDIHYWVSKLEIDILYKERWDWAGHLTFVLCVLVRILIKMQLIHMGCASVIRRQVMTNYTNIVLKSSITVMEILTLPNIHPFIHPYDNKQTLFYNMNKRVVISFITSS